MVYMMSRLHIGPEYSSVDWKGCVIIMLSYCIHDVTPKLNQRHFSNLINVMCQVGSLSNYMLTNSLKTSILIILTDLKFRPTERTVYSVKLLII